MNFSNPAAATLVPTICMIYIFQIAVGIPNVIYQEDRFYGTKQLGRLSEIRYIWDLDLLGSDDVVTLSPISKGAYDCDESRVPASGAPGAQLLSPSSDHHERIDNNVDSQTWYLFQGILLI